MTHSDHRPTNSCLRLTQVSVARAGVYRSDDILAIEQRAMVQGLPLMERAGRAAAQLLLKLYPTARQVALLVGKGNNGGDAWVCARHLRAAGLTVQCYYTEPPSTVDGRAAWQAYQAQQKTQPTAFEESKIKHCDVVVDGLFGSGLRGPLRPPYDRLIARLNQLNRPVLSLDLPSGLLTDVIATGDDDSGQVVRADHTLCFLAFKPGLFNATGFDHTGQLHFSDLGVDEHLYADHKPCFQLALQPPVIRRSANSHKGDYGLVEVVGGQGISEGQSMAGAVLLAARAAARTGCGLVKLLTHADHAGQLTGGFPDAIYLDAERALANRAADQNSVQLLGPGLGVSDWSRRIYRLAVNHPGEQVIDADALNLMAEQSTDDRPPNSGQWILTPHPKEAARLLKCPLTEVQNDRFAAVNELARKLQAVVVLKGRGSLISDGQTTRLCPYGNPGMACAGMGDVLGGIIAALLAQGLGSFEAASQGVVLHALTGDRLLFKKGWSLTASDMIEALWVGDRSQRPTEPWHQR